MSRRKFILGTLAAPALIGMPKAFAESAFPSKSGLIIVPWPAGSSTDVATRAIADTLGKDLGHAMTVDNKPGASGAIGTSFVAKSKADGYTLVTATADTHSINPQVRSDLHYDAVGGFLPLVGFGTVSWAWMTRADLPVNNMKELVALARQKPGQITYASWGVGSTAHIAGALLEKAAGIELNHVPFQGGAPASTAIQGGHVDLMPYLKVQASDFRKFGKVKVIGYASQKRSVDVLTDVPTLAEQGIAGAESGSWYAIMAPKGTPEDVRTRLTSSLAQVVGMPETTSRIVGAGIDPMNLSGAALEEFLRSQYLRYGAIVRERRIQAS